jgi:hypothetical protein
MLLVLNILFLLLRSYLVTEIVTFHLLPYMIHFSAKLKSVFDCPVHQIIQFLLIYDRSLLNDNK